jgi:AcrR family transcriptional regulator
MNNFPEQENLPDSTEQRIFDAAREVFIQKGLDGAKMQEIADKAGINKALLHYYYRSKDKLYEMVARAVINRAIPAMRTIIESELPLEAKINRFVDSYIDIISRNPFIPVFIISEINKHPDKFFETILPQELPKPDVFFRQIEAAIQEGTIAPVKPQHLLVNMISLCVFPFLGKPMIRMVLGMNPVEYKQFLDERKEEVKRVLFASLRPV